MPSVARGSNVMFLSTTSKTRLNMGSPASTPSSFAISLPRALTFPGNRDWVVRSPSPMSSWSASLISLSTALMGNRMVTTGTAAGRGGGGGGWGGWTGRGGSPAGRPAVRHGEPRPRMVGRRIEGTGVTGGGETGAVPAAGCWASVWTGAGGGVTGAGRLTAAALDESFAGAFAGALASFFGPEPAGRGAGLAVLLAFDTVVLPPGLECFFALRGDLLRIRRCRSIWWIQV